jgi:hypoxanthine phosphoribosyltransferase
VLDAEDEEMGLSAPGTRRGDELVAPEALRAASSSPPILLAVGRGATVFHGALAAALAARGVATETDRLTLSRYRTGSGRPRVRVRLHPDADLRGRRVLLVEDVVSTGLSLAYLVGWLRRRGATTEVCVLLDRRSARVVEAPIRYAGFEAPEEVLVGFGLSLFQQFRELPFIAVLSPE